jgi:hypothetical protein
MGCPKHIGLELLAVLDVDEPAALRINPFARPDCRRAAFRPPSSARMCLGRKGQVSVRQSVAVFKLGL